MQNTLGTLTARRCASLAILSALAVCVAGCGKDQGDGLKKYPARGVITINGKPVAGLVVRLTGGDTSSTAANARFPAGVTDDQGVFRVSTNGKEDGGVVGEYGVAVVWPESNEPPLRDRLNGAYATPIKSKLQVTIHPTENVFPPIDLKFDEKSQKVRRPRPE